MDAEREMMQKLPGKKRDRLIAGIYGLGLSLSWLLGRVLERNGALAKPRFSELVLFVFGWLFASSGAFLCGDGWTVKEKITGLKMRFPGRGKSGLSFFPGCF